MTILGVNYLDKFGKICYNSTFAFISYLAFNTIGFVATQIAFRISNNVYDNWLMTVSIDCILTILFVFLLLGMLYLLIIIGKKIMVHINFILDTLTIIIIHTLVIAIVLLLSYKITDLYLWPIRWFFDFFAVICNNSNMYELSEKGSVIAMFSYLPYLFIRIGMFFSNKTNTGS